MREPERRDAASSERPALPPWVTLLAVFLAYSPALFADFVFDDAVFVRGVEAIARPSLDGFRALWTSDARALTGVATSVPYYRPLTFSSFALDHLWGGGAPFAFHFTNLALFGGALLLLERFFHRAVGDRTAAAVLLALFALHPARVETVAWISGRPDVLVLLGTLLASEASRARWAIAVRAVVFLVGGGCALAAKELGVLLPLFVFVGLDAGLRLKRRLLDGWFLAACALVGAYLLFRAVAFPLPPAGRLYGGLEAHLGLVLETIGRNASALTIPVELSMLSATQRTVGGRDVFDGFSMAWGVAFLLVLGAVLVVFRRRPRLLELGVVFVFALLPTANLWPMPALVATTPRFVFVPAVFFVAFVAEVVRCFRLDGRLRVVGRSNVVARAAVAVLAASTVVRVLDFASDETFFRAEARSASRVPMVVEARMQSDLRAGDLPRAVVRAECGLVAIRTDYPRASSGEELLIPLLGPITAALADGDTPTLRAWGEFLHALREATHASVAFPLSVEVSERSRLAHTLEPRRAWLAVLEADVLLRLGRAPEALALLAAVEPRLRSRDDARLWLRGATRAGDLGGVERVAERFPGALRDPALSVLIAAARETGDEAAARALDPERLALLAAHRVGLAGNVVRIARRLWGAELAFPRGDEALAEVALFAADFAGDVEATATLASRLHVPPPARELPLGRARLAELRASLVDGCRFRGE